MKYYLPFAAFWVQFFISWDSPAQHHIFMDAVSRTRLIQRLEKDIALAYQKYTGEQRDTLVFRKSDTLYVQWSQLKPETKPRASQLLIVADSLNTIFNRYQWEAGRYVAKEYMSQALAYSGKPDSAYFVLSDLNRIYGDQLSDYEHAWLYINLAEKLLYWNVVTDNDNAEEFLTSALALGKKTKSWEVIHKVYAIWGEIQMSKKNYSKALEYFEKQRSFFDIHGNINIGYHSEGANLANLGICHLHLGNEKNATRILELFFQKNSPEMGAYANYLHQTVLMGYSNFHIQKKDFNQALYYENLYQKILAHRLPQDYIDHYNRLYQIYKGKENYRKALEYYEKHTSLEDSLKVAQLSKSFKEIEQKFDLEKKESEIKELQNLALTRENEKQKNIRNFALVIAGLFILLIFLVIRALIIQRKNNRLKLDLSQSQNKLVRQIIQVQNEERERIAQDLHDDLGGSLAALSSRLEKLKQISSPGKMKDETAKIARLSSTMGSRIRHLSHNLMPPEFEKAGLIESLREHLQAFQKIKIRFMVFGDEKRMPTERELNIYRILTEITTNILKHSGASDITFQIFFHETLLSVIIENDTLKKFDQQNVGGLGLKSINSRVEILNGALTIDAGESFTTQMLNIPYE